MTDIRTITIYNLDGVTMDWLLTPMGTLDETQELATAVKIALGTDSLASPDETLPDIDSTDRRGWWGDTECELIWNAWPIGCRNWLLTRAKITPTDASESGTLVRAENYTLDALDPFVENRVVSRVEATATRRDKQSIVVDVTLFRGPLPSIALRYEMLWEGIGPSSVNPYPLTR